MSPFYKKSPTAFITPRRTHINEKNNLLKQTTVAINPKNKNLSLTSPSVNIANSPLKP